MADNRCVESITRPVGNDVRIDAQTIVARGQQAARQHTQGLAEAARVQTNRNRNVVGRAEASVSTSAQKVHAAGVQTRKVEGLIKGDFDRADEETAGAFVHADRNDLGCEGVGNDVERDNIGQCEVAAGVGSAYLQRQCIAAKGNAWRLREQIPREGHVIGHDPAVDQQFDVTDLHVIGDRRHDAHSAPLEHLDTRCGWIDVDAIGRDRNVWCNAFGVEARVIDNLQSARAIGDKG
ncbi:MAG: hypothetical protein AW10_00140 [Candidatus Accumulibacter appositus]|uniref:Uncharacterized protein n=1 Tax=Candidatus Accumulibacter appositus TaxID=1454003 RepID=A0A011P5Q2_9PROT|nr:MAG: hypothetical protein AW10_00140 [Candidatus Accumulibacter appositus]